MSGLVNAGANTGDGRALNPFRQVPDALATRLRELAGLTPSPALR